jgi:hypothetical protein
VLVLIGLLLVFTTFALKITAGRSVLPFFVPTAAAGILIAILLDASAAVMLTAVIAVIGGAVNGNSLELTAYIFLGGMAGIVAVRRGDRLNAFVQAAVAIFVVNALVVSTFSLLGERDITGVLQLYGASAASAGGSAVAAVGSFAVIGNLFGILTIFQLLELANPSQPLLRRLLIETPGHVPPLDHGRQPGRASRRGDRGRSADHPRRRLLPRRRQAGQPAGVHREPGQRRQRPRRPDPDVSATILKEHVGDGIEIAYRANLPKPLIAFIPQHHGTAPSELLLLEGPRGGAAPYGGPGDAEGEKAANAVDQRLPPQRPQAPEPRGGPADAGRRRRGVGPLALVARRAGDPGDGQPDHRGAPPGRPVRRVRPDPARPRADPRGVRRSSSGCTTSGSPIRSRRSSSSRRAAPRPAAAAAAERRVLRQLQRRWGLDRPPFRSRNRARSTSGAGESTSPSGRASSGSCRHGPGSGDRRRAGRGRGAQPASIGLILADDPELASLNVRHMGKDGPTDVLSFPLLPPAAFPAQPGGPSRPALGPVAFALPPGRRLHLGDIVGLGRAGGRAGSRPAGAARPATSAGQRPTSCACW